MMHGLRWLFFVAALVCAWIWTMDYSTELWQNTEQRDCATGLVHTRHGWAMLGGIFILLGGVSFASKGYPDWRRELVG